ncbi:hypothetical protein C7212DRAFT_346585 [Tuber magnatum]|uniref:Uncharacterized protein n=1 Tax=Tuber magnatum TaxID=42249 RepID=A0A317SJW2_9PEZI|nr:hypothetical protein C7212DRAFT_346585 [Tuber magnatum]
MGRCKYGVLPLELIAGSLEAEFQASTDLVLAIGIQLSGIFGYEAGRLQAKTSKAEMKRTYTATTKEDNAQAWPGSKHKTLANSTTVILEENEAKPDPITPIGQDRTINTKALGTILFNIKTPFQDQCHPIVDKRGEEDKALAKWNNQQQGIPSAIFGTQTDTGVVTTSGAPILQEVGMSVPTMGPIVTIGDSNKNITAILTTATTAAASNPAAPTTPHTGTAQAPVIPMGPVASPPVGPGTGFSPPSTFPDTPQSGIAPPSTLPGTITSQNPTDPANAGQIQLGQTMSGQAQDLPPPAYDLTAGQPITNTPPTDPATNPSIQQYPAVAVDTYSQPQYPPFSSPPAGAGTDLYARQVYRNYNSLQSLKDMHSNPKHRHTCPLLSSLLHRGDIQDF